MREPSDVALARLVENWMNEQMEVSVFLNQMDGLWVGLSVSYAQGLYDDHVGLPPRLDGWPVPVAPREPSAARDWVTICFWLCVFFLWCYLMGWL